MRATIKTLDTGYKVELLEWPYATGRGRTVEGAIRQLVSSLLREGYTVYWREFTSAETEKAGDVA